MRSRCVLTKKALEGVTTGRAWKAKARWVVLGYTDPDLADVRRSSPTASGDAVRLAFFLCAQYQNDDRVRRCENGIHARKGGRP